MHHPANLSAFFTQLCGLRCNLGCVNALGYRQHLLQQGALRVGLVVQAQAALCVALAGQQGIGKAGGLAEGVATL